MRIEEQVDFAVETGALKVRVFDEDNSLAAMRQFLRLREQALNPCELGVFIHYAQLPSGGWLMNCMCGWIFSGSPGVIGSSLPSPCRTLSTYPAGAPNR